MQHGRKFVAPFVTFTRVQDIDKAFAFVMSDQVSQPSDIITFGYTIALYQGRSQKMHQGVITLAIFQTVAKPGLLITHPAGWRKRPDFIHRKIDLLLGKRL
ncbi:hypothetical protein CO724_16520 [Ectopseudomonas mendocina]|nr:hypothetical protein CO724_16520 [Pseudomonas mendocina]